MMTINEQIKAHVLVYASLLNVRCFFSSNTREHLSLVREMSNIDSISDYSLFSEQMKFAKKNQSVTMPRYDNYCRESIRNYGYYQEILKYAGIGETLIPYFAVEHGVRFSASHWTACSEKTTDTIIHYASSYYSDEKINQMKNKLGRILLVFPSHTWEYGTEKTDTTGLLNIVYKKYAASYDNIMLCTYWNDVDAPILSEFEKNGAILVSAGFRNDPNFVRRLKTIITLADDVILDDIGPNIGFCKYMGKSVFLEGEGSRFPKDKVYTHNYNQFHAAFYSHDREFTPLQYQQQDELYEFFWGGEKYLRTPEEIRAMIMVLKEMCDATHYNLNKMRDFIRRNCRSHISELGYKLLADSIDVKALDELIILKD